jgi:hypothetical protein
MKLMPGPSTLFSRPKRSTTCCSDCGTMRIARKQAENDEKREQQNHEVPAQKLRKQLIHN